MACVGYPLRLFGARRQSEAATPLWIPANLKNGETNTARAVGY